jgi:hypothetical protein
MASSPNYKIYYNGEYRAACKYIEDAACLVAFLGKGAVIKFYHSFVMWKEGYEKQSASESYDYVAEVAEKRFKEYSLKKWGRYHGKGKSM